MWRCDVCKTIYVEEECRECNYCDATICENCFETYEIFEYHGEIRCDLCFPLLLPTPTSKEILSYALSLLGKSYADLQTECQQSEYFAKRHPLADYFCQTDKDPKHDCIGTDCLNLVNGFRSHDDEYFFVQIERGICCKAEMPDMPENWCENCKRVKKKQKL